MSTSHQFTFDVKAFVTVHGLLGGMIGELR